MPISHAKFLAKISQPQPTHHVNIPVPQAVTKVFDKVRSAHLSACIAMKAMKAKFHELQDRHHPAIKRTVPPHTLKSMATKFKEMKEKIFCIH